MKLPVARSIVSALLLLLSVMSLSATAASSKPNILVIWGDDIGWSNISAYHRGMLGSRTPITMASKAVLPGVRPSSPASIHCAPGC
jgi:hypothetical protein